MTGLAQPFRSLACAARFAARAAARRVALIGAALLVAALGAGFLLLAGFLGLGLLFGPGVAALVMGAALLGAAAGLFLMARGPDQPPPPQVTSRPDPARKSPVPPEAADAATMAVFTAAFLLGRYLAGRSDTSRNS